MSLLLITALTVWNSSACSIETPETGDFLTGTREVVSASEESDASLHRGWPVNLGSPGAGFPYTPVLCDVDNNGSCEIFLTGGETFGLGGDGSFLPGWPTHEMAYMGYASTGQLPGPSAGDMNGDGTPEIMWSTRDWYAGSAYLWTFNGRSPSGINLSGYPLTAPDQSSNALASPFVLGDSDGDGNLEAVTAHTLGNTGDYYRISKLDYDGNILFTIDLDPSEDILDIYFGDADGDGGEEFFAVTLFSGDFRLYLLNSGGGYQPGYPATIHSLSSGYLMFGPPIPADLDGDGDLEIILGYNVSSTSYAMAVHHDGTAVSGFPITISSGSQLFYLGMGDITGDDTPELLAIDNQLSSDYRAWAIDMASGAPLTGWPVTVTDWPKGFPAVADLDNDGNQDISFATDGGSLHALSSDGTELTGFPKTMSAASTSGTVVGDIDGDGLYEIVAATWDGWVYAWDTDGVVSSDNRDWPMRGVDPHNTGIYRGSAQSGMESNAQPVSFSITANPVTSIALFSVIGMDAEPEIEIYDVTGKLMARTSGCWTPAEDCSNGVYFARLSRADVQPVKFVLVR